MDLKVDLKDTFYPKKGIIVYVLLFLLGFSIPISNALNSLVIATFFLYSFYNFNIRNYKKLYKENLLYLIFFVYYSLVFFSICYATDTSKAIDNLTKKIVFILIPISFINLSKIIKRRHLDIALFGFVLSVLVLLFYIYINVFIDLYTTNKSLNSLFTHYVRTNFISYGYVKIHAPYLGLLVVFTIVAIFYFPLKQLYRYTFICKTTLLLFLVSSLYSISSFMAILLLVILLMALGIYLILKKQWKILSLFTTVIVVSFILLIVNFKTLSKNHDGTTLLGRIEWSFIKNKGDTSRPHNWKSVLKVVKNNVLIGIGGDGGLNLLQEYRDPKSESYINKHNAHNQYLETLLRYGFLGLFMLIAILLIQFKMAISHKDMIYLWFLIIFCISCITESYLQRQIGLTFFVFFSCLFYSVNSPITNLSSKT